MKSSRNERLSEHLLNVGEEILANAYEIDDAEKLRQYIKTKRSKTTKPFCMTPVSRRIAAVAACFVLIIGVVFSLPAFFNQGKDDPSKLESYNVELSGISEGGIFNVPEKVFQGNVSEQNKLEVPVESEITLGKKSIVADLTSKYVDSNKSIYVSKDGNINYVKSGDSDSFSISVRGSGVLRSFKKDSFNEEELVNNIKDYISEYLDLSMLDSYVYTCSTKLQVSKPDAAWNETKEGFYVSAETGETVRSYTVEYRKYYNNYKTADYLSVNCDPNGNILAFAFYDSNTDWLGGEFDAKSVEQSVEKYLKDSIKSEWQIEDYKITNECLVCVDGKICLSADIELTLTKNGDKSNTISPVCALRISK